MDQTLKELLEVAKDRAVEAEDYEAQEVIDAILRRPDAPDATAAIMDINQTEFVMIGGPMQGRTQSNDSRHDVECDEPFHPRRVTFGLTNFRENSRRHHYRLRSFAWGLGRRIKHLYYYVHESMNDAQALSHLFSGRNNRIETYHEWRGRMRAEGREELI